MKAASQLRHDQVGAGRSPAVQYRFVSSDSVIFRPDEGMADVVKRLPVSSRTTYNGFSVTKTFTATARHVYYAHAGGGGGYYTGLRIYPELQRGSVILFNRTGMSDERSLDRVDHDLIRADAVQ